MYIRRIRARFLYPPICQEDELSEEEAEEGGQAEEGEEGGEGVAKTVSAEEASKAKPKVRKSLAQELTLEAMDRSLQKPVDQKKLIASKVPPVILFRPCGLSDSTFGSPLARQPVAWLGRRAHLSCSPRLQAGSSPSRWSQHRLRPRTR